MQEIAYQCPLDDREKFWSEETVSEDFDMALRLQTAGYLVRLAAYSNGGFEEGVSLTVYDELMRWEKYAYGCNELIFYPLSSWFRTGPFTPLFRNFLASAMPLPSKITIMAYIGTYYALGSSWMLTLLNYFVVGWLYGYQDSYYRDSFKIIVAIIAIFTLVGNIALATLRYRLGERALLPALAENLKWIPLLFVFLGGVSLHVSQALLAHMFGVPMIWGATSKEAENVSFFEEIPRVLKRFKWTFAVCGVLTALMVGMATLAPAMWRIEYMTAIVPLAMVVFSHFMLPIVLNPNLMLFTW
jgi:cellulose synthase/poly-beta-1,6-N-acetylglucosamine synthase-like glycosyltransferase